MIITSPGHLMRAGELIQAGEPGARKRYYCVTRVLDVNQFEVRPAGRLKVIRFRIAEWFKRWKRWIR